MSDFRDKLAKKKAELDSKNRGGNAKNAVHIMKQGDHYLRIVPQPEDESWFREALRVYINNEYLIVPKVAKQDSVFKLLHDHLKSQGDADDLAHAKKLQEREVAYIYCYVYADSKRKSLMYDKPRYVPLSSGVFSDLINYTLDDEWGDPADAQNGYDLCIKRVGSTLQDTEYSLSVKPKSPLKREVLGELYGKTFNLDEQFQPILSSHAECLEALAKYMGMDSIEELLETYPFLADMSGMKKTKKKVSRVEEDEEDDEPPVVKKKKKKVIVEEDEEEAPVVRKKKKIVR